LGGSSDERSDRSDPSDGSEAALLLELKRVEVRVPHEELKPDGSARERAHVRVAAPAHAAIDFVGGVDEVTLLRGKALEG